MQDLLYDATKDGSGSQRYYLFADNINGMYSRYTDGQRREGVENLIEPLKEITMRIERMFVKVLGSTRQSRQPNKTVFGQR